MRKEVNLETGEILELADVPTVERPIQEIDAALLQNKINKANMYLNQTDWVNTYKIRHDLGLELIPEDSSKWEVIIKREEYITFLKGDK